MLATLVGFLPLSLASAMRLAARALPLCGAALTFFAAAKKVREGLNNPFFYRTSAERPRQGSRYHWHGVRPLPVASFTQRLDIR
ncbi:hypothetical protein AB4Y32_13600, partial [Paraburkholderia phymatum]